MSRLALNQLPVPVMEPLVLGGETGLSRTALAARGSDSAGAICCFSTSPVIMKLFLHIQERAGLWSVLS